MTNANEMTAHDMQVQIEGFNRQELRAACKAAGIQYSKLDAAGMRGALIALIPQDEPAVAAPQGWESTGAGTDQYTAANVRDQHCPGCNIHLSNGVLSKDDYALVNKDGSGFATEGDKTYYELGENNHDFECMGCGHQFGTLHAPYVAKTGLKIEKDRPEQNGIKRPSAGGRCRAVWDELDAFVAARGEQPTSKDVKAIAAAQGWNANNASIEFYQWRKFNGITGRVAKA